MHFRQLTQFEALFINIRAFWGQMLAPIWLQVGPYLAPSWLQVGSKLAPTFKMLESPLLSLKKSYARKTTNIISAGRWNSRKAFTCWKMYLSRPRPQPRTLTMRPRESTMKILLRASCRGVPSSSIASARRLAMPIEACGGDGAGNVRRKLKVWG